MAKTTSTVADIELDGEELDMTQFFSGDFWEGHKPQQDFSEPVPAGTYNAKVGTVEGPILNNAGTAYYMKFPFIITDGDYEGRYVWMNLSLMDKVLWKVQQVFAALGKEPGETGYVPGEFDDTECRIKIKVREATAQYGASNDVDRVMPPREDRIEADWLT
jgi:hypothetical protein